MLTALLFWIIVGLIAGALAKLVMPGDDPGGIVVTIIIGIVGAVLGGFLLSLLGIGGGAGSGGFIFSIIAGVIGAVILLARSGDTASYLQASCEPDHLALTKFKEPGPLDPGSFLCPQVFEKTLF